MGTSVRTAPARPLPADDARADPPDRGHGAAVRVAIRCQTVQALDGVAGFVEAPTFYPYLSGRRNLELLAAFDGGDAGDRIEMALETVELTDRARDQLGGYSHGMRQRIGIAAALLRDPKLLLLDEPATGLDPAGMRDMRLLIRRLADQGMTVLLSSHLLAEVEELCNRVAIVRKGQDRLRGRDRRSEARRRRRPTACRAPTTSARWRCAAPSRGSATSGSCTGRSRSPPTSPRSPTCRRR